jgi:dTDP-4-dehydrorhamnose reductase
VVCPADQVSSPSYAPDVARTVVDLATQARSGIVHVVGPEVMSRLAFARAIAAAFGLDPARIIPKTTAEIGQGAPRPLRGGLLTAKLDAWIPHAMRPLSECLDDFRKRLAAKEGWADPMERP